MGRGACANGARSGLSTQIRHARIRAVSASSPASEEDGEGILRTTMIGGAHPGRTGASESVADATSPANFLYP